jgi:PDZ domain-containing protein/BON domain-containing protein
MGKNGGTSADAILTLEEALMHFKRKKEAGAEAKGESESGVHPADSSATAEGASEGTFEGGLQTAAEGDLNTAEDSASFTAQRDEAGAGTPAVEDIVAVIGGIPRTLEQLEQLAAAEEAYQHDFSQNDVADAEVDDVDLGEPEVAALAGRHALIRDFAFTAMGAAMMVLVAFLMTRVPIVNGPPSLVAQSIATPALKASSPMSVEDLIASWVTIPETNEQLAAGPRVKKSELETRIKDMLKTRAFTDIGVSVSSMGDAYLAGEVYSLDEAHRIKQIVHRVNGVNGVHFLHPDVLPANGPAYFGVETAFAPDVWGAKVRAVIIGSPADKAGIQPGDVISEFDGETIPDAKTLDDVIAQYSPGQRVQFRVWHDGQPEYLLARLGEMTPMASREATPPAVSHEPKATSRATTPAATARETKPATSPETAPVTSPAVTTVASR